MAAPPTCPNLAEPTQRNLLYYKHAILVNSFNWSSKSSLKDVLLMLIVHTCAPPPPLAAPDHDKTHKMIHWLPYLHVSKLLLKGTTHQSSHSSFFLAAGGAAALPRALPMPIALVPMELLAFFCSARLEKSSQKSLRLASRGASRRAWSLPSTKRLNPSCAFLPAACACFANAAAVSCACLAKSPSANCVQPCVSVVLLFSLQHRLCVIELTLFAVGWM